MATIDCPFCEGPMDAEALFREGELRCKGCAVALELAPDEPANLVAAAA
jgi:hypothetical protein